MGSGKHKNPGGARDVQEVLSEIRKLRAEVGGIDRRVRAMEAHGGFADTKTLSMRCGFVESRIAVLEDDTPMLRDVTTSLTEALQEHLVFRHGVAPTLLESAGDVMGVRNIRRRLMLWLEKTAQRRRKPGVNDARRNETRIRSVMGERPNLPPLPTKHRGEQSDA